MCHYYKPHRDFFLIKIFFAGPLLMTELQNGAIGYPSTAWQMVWERSKTMRLIYLKRRVTDLFTDFVFPAMEGDKSWGQSVTFWLYRHSGYNTVLYILKTETYIFIYKYCLCVAELKISVVCVTVIDLMLLFFTSLISGGVKFWVMYFWSIRHFDNIFGSFLCQASNNSFKKKKGKNTCGQWFFLNNYVFKEYENYFECENWQWDLFLNTLRKCLTKLLILPFSFNRLCQELYNWKRSRLQRDNICHQKWYSVSGLELNDSPWAQVRVQQQRQWE